MAKRRAGRTRESLRMRRSPGRRRSGRSAKSVVGVGAGGAVEDEHAAGAADGGRSLGDEVFGEVEVEVGDAHWVSLRDAVAVAALPGHLDGRGRGRTGRSASAGRWLGGDVGGPGDEDAGEGFGDEEAVPGAELPGAVGQGVEDADPGGVDQSWRAARRRVWRPWRGRGGHRR